MPPSDGMNPPSEPFNGSRLPDWVTVRVADGPPAAATVTAAERSQPSFGSASIETDPEPFPDAGDILNQSGSVAITLRVLN